MIKQRGFVVVGLVVLATMARAIFCQDQVESLVDQTNANSASTDGLESLQRPPFEAVSLDTGCTTWRCTARTYLAKRLIHFNDFKRKFNKRYRNSGEESLRRALYSERLIKVSMSVMRYFSHMADTYKSINSRSDMTKRERDQMKATLPSRIGPERVIKRSSRQIFVEDEDAVVVVEDPDEPQDIEPTEAPNEAPSDQPRRKDPQGAQRRLAPPPPPPPPPAPTNGGGGFSWFSAFTGMRPSGIDLRRTNCLGPAGDQGTCESCASFVAIAQIEYLRCRETGTLEKFSEQFPVDCGEPFGMMGCAGADVHSVNKFIAQVGLMPSASYPYVGRRTRCPYYNRSSRRYNFETADTLKLKRQGIMGVKSNKWSKFLEQKIPLHVGVLINEDFEDYGGGVARSCSNHQGAHGMLLIGEGREDGVDYWLLRNSYGDWGLEGNYKLSKRATKCLSDEEMGYYPSAFIKTFGSSFVRNFD